MNRVQLQTRCLTVYARDEQLAEKNSILIYMLMARQIVSQPHGKQTAITLAKCNGRRGRGVSRRWGIDLSIPAAAASGESTQNSAQALSGNEGTWKRSAELSSS